MTKRAIVFLLALFAVQSLELHAQDNQSISSDLKTYKITSKSGQEVATEVNQVQPGDTIEYRLTYTNNSNEAISNLVPILPIPQGTQYLAETASPSLNGASITSSGQNFQSLPLTRMVTNENGNQVEQEIPASEYRRLQWMVSTLEGGESITLNARVKVNNAN